MKLLASGPNSIPQRFIKMARVVLVPILAELYNKCLKEKCFPDEFNLNHVIPIPKTAAPKELGNFRPISLLNVFSKIFEKLLRDKMLSFINKNNLLASQQFGFTTNTVFPPNKQQLPFMTSFWITLIINNILVQFFLILKKHLIL